MDIFVDYSGREAHAWAAAVQLRSGKLLMLGGALTPAALRHWDAEEHAYLACAATLRALGQDPSTATFHSDGVVACARHNLRRVSGTHPTHRLAHQMSRKIREALERTQTRSAPEPVPVPALVTPKKTMQLTPKSASQAKKKAPATSAPVASAPVASAPVASAPVASAPVASAPVDLQARRDAYGAALHRLRCRAGTLPAPLKDDAGQHLKTLAGQLSTFPRELPRKARARFEMLLNLDAQGMPGMKTWAETLPGQLMA